MKKALIIRRHGSLGDMLMMTPALREFSKTYQIDLKIPEDYFQLFYNLNYLNYFFDIADDIDFSCYEKIIDLSDYEFNYEQIYQLDIDKTKMDLFADALKVKLKNYDLDINLTPDEKKWIIDYFEKNKITKRKTILLAIKSENYTRDWQLEKWKKLIDRLKKLEFNLIIVDKELNWKDPDLIFFNNHNLRELFSLVSNSDYVICHDSGLLHLGAAFNKIVLAIFGPTDPKIRCVYKNSYWVSNGIGLKPTWYDRSNYKDYFEEISVGDVERKFLDVVSNG